MFLEAEGCNRAADRRRSVVDKKEEEEEKATMKLCKEKNTDAHEPRLQL